ncbi:hypothetical protein RJ639_032989 [Escallonia herrerae]|uniref:Uncharacterized protein n=1 Tax=Escallonia herrerae TaxID=1293975 RepID=A0AA89BGN6_9ASTE|nr:hypothetical protein RJ639_032989 [Escallonia herrerae]
MQVEGVKKAGEELEETEGEGGMGKAKAAAFELVMVVKVAVEDREMEGTVVKVAAEEAVVIEAKEVIEARGNSMVARGMKGEVVRVEVGAKVAIEAEVELPIKLAWHKDSIAGPSSQSIPSTYGISSLYTPYLSVVLLTEKLICSLVLGEFALNKHCRCTSTSNQQGQRIKTQEGIFCTYIFISCAEAIGRATCLRQYLVQLNQLVASLPNPYGKFVHHTANKALFFEALGDEECVHVIDLDLAEGYEWPAFMYDMAARPGESKFLSNNSRVPF